MHHSAKKTIALARFQLRTVLLAFVVVATMCDVFLRPEPTLRTLGNTLVIEAFYEAPPRAANGQTNRVAMPIEHGHWRLRTLSGRRLAEGSYRRGEAAGRWQFYGARGQRLAEGACEQGVLVGRWTNWTDEGKRACEAQFASIADVPLPVVKGNESLRRESLRNGPVVWWTASGQVEREFTFGNDAVVSLPNGASGAIKARDDRPSMDQLRALLDSPGFQDRCLALRELRKQGVAAVPLLVTVIRQPDHPARGNALRTLEQLEADASTAVEALAAIAHSPDDPMAAAVTCTLLTIDAPRRDTWIRHLFKGTLAENPQDASLFRSIAWRHSPAALATGLAPFVNDQRVDARRLTAGLLMWALRSVTETADTKDDWYSDLFNLGLEATGYLNAAEAKVSADALIAQLEKMEADHDTEIRTNVAEVLRLWRAKKIRTSTVYLYPNNFCCF
jgi:hypothetical protein